MVFGWAALPTTTSNFDIKTWVTVASAGAAGPWSMLWVGAAKLTEVVLTVKATNRAANKVFMILVFIRFIQMLFKFNTTFLGRGDDTKEALSRLEKKWNRPV